MSRLILCVLLVSLLPTPGWMLRNVTSRFYQTLQRNSAVSCFRLTNATSQIGCSASSSYVRGVLYYVNSTTALDEVLNRVPHPPFVVLIEPQLFIKANVMELYKSPRVNGIVVRYHDGSSPPDLMRFSPETECPNDGFGKGTCSHPWNTDGSSMSFMDFKDFPIFAVENSTFEDELLKCYSDYNVDLSGGVSDYPLCSMELYADMSAAVDTPTCFRRANLPMPYLNNVGYCDALGDMNVWGTMFQLQEPVRDVIMLAAKVDSNSFFLDHSYGANSEVAGIVTLLAVVDQLGRLKRSDAAQVTHTTRPIMYTFFHGESWDYIGSSRMVYDMQKDVFPYSRNKDKQQLPVVGLQNVTTFFELGQLGVDLNSDELFVHGDMDSPLVPVLKETLESYNLTVSQSSDSSLCDLPPASLQRFLRGKNVTCTGSSSFKGSILASFDQNFTNRFYHSRYDNFYNLQSELSLQDVAKRLSNIATGVARGVVNASQPSCNGGCDQDVINDVLEANSTLVGQLLECFLVDPNCTLFQSVLTKQLAKNHLFEREFPLSRYVTINTVTNLETILIFQLASYFGANFNDNITNYIKCSDCYRTFNKTDQTKNSTAMQWQWRSDSKDEEDMCLCIDSYTYQHKAMSPAFDLKQYDSTEYSTWAESRWTAISARVYLITYAGIEVGALIGGAALSSITFVLAFLCKRKSDEIFEPKLYRLLQQ